MSIQVLVCEQLPIFRDGLCTLLEAAPDVKIIESTSSGIQALTVARARRPDVVVTGLALEGITGLELVQRLAREIIDPRPRTVVFAMSDSDETIRKVLHAEVNGVLTKDASRDEIMVAVRAAARGQTMLAPPIAQRLIQWFRRGDNLPEEPLQSVVSMLTARERQVLTMLADGKSTGEVAKELVIGITTVRTHVYRLRCKLNLHDRTQLVSFAYRSGLMRSA